MNQRLTETTTLDAVISSTKRKHSLMDALLGAEEFRSSSTGAIETSDLQKEISELFAYGRQQDFEDGVYSKFSRQLVELIKSLQSTALLGVVASLIIHEKVNPVVAAEALKWIGNLEHPNTYYYRLWLLERSLLNSSSRVRDGAAIGLASMDDPHSIEPLKDAVKREKYAELRLELERVISQLDSQCHLSLER